MFLSVTDPTITDMTLEVTDNAERKRFEARVEGHMVLIEYIRTRDKIYLTHTEVPPALNGKGYGSAMVAEVLQIVDGMGLQLIPLCPFVAGYIIKHPLWGALLADGYHV